MCIRDRYQRRVHGITNKYQRTRGNTMKQLVLLAFLVIGSQCFALNMNALDFNGIDYLPATEAFTKIKVIQSEYETFRQKIAKNVSIDYEKCVKSIKELKCNNLDQWQSVIEELKLQNQNSIDIEVPFLKNRKAKKVERLKQLIGTTDQFDGEMLEIVGKLAAQQGELLKGAFEVNAMYKLPKPEPVEFVQQDINVPASLNADVPKVAREEITKAKSQYEVADISIQAEAARDEMESAAMKMQKVIEDLQQSFEFKQNEVREEKRQLKDDIIRIRALLANEQAIQDRNTAKIGEMEGHIGACAGKPTNVEKDCEPIKMRAAKMNTEIDIIMARTMKLYKQVGQLMDENEEDSEIGAKKEQIAAEKAAAKEKAEEMSYIIEEDPSSRAGPYVDPQERKPVHHLKENLPQ
eukprot:TRINITY_DN45_c0_g1_i2.p1 TRINITY_DN45_c0_g1~~TRINITY_DN45_c0_g1_i2.p1  ORF type:complete len:408 (-),score=90.93 TRINITY_DN45_c0_g1_i2:186-1409(-)